VRLIFNDHFDGSDRALVWHVCLKVWTIDFYAVYLDHVYY